LERELQQKTAFSGLLCILSRLGLALALARSRAARTCFVIPAVIDLIRAARISFTDHPPSCFNQVTRHGDHRLLMILV